MSERGRADDAGLERSIDPIAGTIYLAADGFDRELRDELGREATPVGAGGRLLLVPGEPRDVSWAADRWLSPTRIRFGSVAEGANALRSLGRSWVHFAASHPRRATLIAQSLPPVATAPLAFPKDAPGPPPGAFTLLSPNEMIASARTTSPFPLGEARFVEDHKNPPSRAYLKLWEACTIAGRHPKPGARCIDLGSSPGGWTWALERLGARVISVDKAPIDPRLTRLTRVRYVKDSAFAVDPSTVGRIDWVFSDVICYPERSARLIERWLAVHPAASFVVTIKLQGATDTSSVRTLAAMPGARLVHLHHNRHELTWIRLGPE